MGEGFGFEAAFLRAAVRVGLVEAAEVPAWAAEQMSTAPAASAHLAQVLQAAPAVEPMREALRPLAETADQSRVAASLLMAVALEPALRARPAAERLRMLAGIRREFPLPSGMAAIQDLEAGASAMELAPWLDRLCGEGWFWFQFPQPQAAAAFVAALSRKMARDRTWSQPADASAASAWVLRGADGMPPAVILNQRAWCIAVREFSPLPLSARIPHLSLPPAAVVILEEATAAPLGAEEAGSRLAGG